MVLAKCSKCLATAIGSTFEEARNKINHAVGLSRGVKCGDNYNKVKEIKEEVTIDEPTQTLHKAPKNTQKKKESTSKKVKTSNVSETTDSKSVESE